MKNEVSITQRTPREDRMFSGYARCLSEKDAGAHREATTLRSLICGPNQAALDQVFPSPFGRGLMTVCNLQDVFYNFNALHLAIY